MTEEEIRKVIHEEIRTTLKEIEREKEEISRHREILRKEIEMANPPIMGYITY